MVAGSQLSPRFLLLEEQTVVPVRAPEVLERAFLFLIVWKPRLGLGVSEGAGAGRGWILGSRTPCPLRKSCQNLSERGC